MKKSRSIADILDLPKDELVRIDRKAKTIDIVDGKDEFWSWKDPYYIDFNRIKSSAALLGWILHLSEKTWWTNEHTRSLIFAWQNVTDGEVHRDA